MFSVHFPCGVQCSGGNDSDDDDDDGFDDDDDGDDDEFDLCVMLAGRWWSDSDKWASRRSDYLTVVLSQSQSSDCRPNEDGDDDDYDDDDDDDNQLNLLCKIGQHCMGQSRSTPSWTSTTKTA